MMSVFYIVILYMYIVGMFSFGYKSMHFLLMLLSLEFLSVVMFFGLLALIWGMGEEFVLIYYLIFCVCEGALGLSILVCMARCFGNDYLQSMSLLKC
uniref:NADH-ubiquinone oxidoreductase chain 4L n=1 Tax=Archipsocus nomas TaxID=239250 RepID=A0A343QCF7_9NEOP|nr:NADH dehydrogenase subunit 4L [Archipsocus nomas]ATU07104.1 NADH dehydrogenase subunit 4L [Archipsocus nomas]